MAEKPPFAEPDALAEWIGEGIDATSADWKRARRVLRAASNLVRTQTGRDWLNDDGTLDNPLPEQLVDVTVAGVGVISTTRGEHASQDMSPYWSEDDGRPGFLHARLTG